MKLKTLSVFLITLTIILSLPASVLAQKVGASGSVESESKEEIKGPAKRKITKKDGTVIEIEVKEGGSVIITDKDKAEVDIEVSKTPVSDILNITGLIDPSKGLLTLNFPTETKEMFGVEDLEIPETMEFSFDIQIDDLDNPRIATFINEQTTFTLPSIDILNGEAETGPITITINPNVQGVGEINFITGEYSTSYSLIVDMPNMRQANGEPLIIEQTVNGKISKELIDQITNKINGGINFTVTGTVSAVIIVLIIISVLFIRKRSKKE